MVLNGLKQEDLHENEACDRLSSSSGPYTGAQVLSKRQGTPLTNKVLQPKLNLGSKALRSS